jgi:excisionase family DNA binding protein
MPNMQQQSTENTNSNTYFEPLLSDKQAAKLLGDMHPKALQRMARSGRVTAHKIGRFWKFRASELNRWVNKGCVPDSSAVN